MVKTEDYFPLKIEVTLKKVKAEVEAVHIIKRGIV